MPFVKKQGKTTTEAAALGKKSKKVAAEHDESDGEDREEEPVENSKKRLASKSTTVSKTKKLKDIKDSIDVASKERPDKKNGTNEKDETTKKDHENDDEYADAVETAASAKKAGRPKKGADARNGKGSTTTALKSKDTKAKAETKKAAPKEENDEPGQEEGSPPKKPRRNVREKAATNYADVDSDGEKEDAPKKAPAKRGAPRKVAATSAEADVDELDADKEGIPKKAPGKRGAPKKAAANGKAEAKSDDAKKESPPEEKKAPAKRVGRQKTAKEAEEIMADEDHDEKAEPTKDAAAKSSGEESESAEAATEDFENDSKTKDGRKWNFKICEWNVAGLRAWVNKNGCLEYLKKENPDVMFFQETKCTFEELPNEVKNMKDYHAYFPPTGIGKKGYAGVGMLSKVKPLNVMYGMGIEKHDEDLRLLTAEFEKFYLVGAYVPNSGRGLPRLEYRQEWNIDFLKFIKNLDAKKPVVYCGDLNVAHDEIDLANPKTNKKTPGFTMEERRDFTELLANGFVDTFRLLYPTKTGAYTFWSNMGNSRSKNVGWRLDYFLVSKRFANNVCDNVIRAKVTGSDHCPSTLFLAL